MTLYLLDTNRLSAVLNDDVGVRRAMRDLRLRGDRLGTCVPALCELQTSIFLTARREHNQRLLKELLKQVRVWPLDSRTAIGYGEL
jgi:predicted nucleic acid-binding protein